MEISISDKGYKGHTKGIAVLSHYFTKNGTYYVDVEVNFGNNVKALFPQMSISCTCKTGKGSVSCSIKQQGKWEVTFETADPGNYTVMATLRISGEDYREKTETIRLLYEHDKLSDAKGATPRILSEWPFSLKGNKAHQ